VFKNLEALVLSPSDTDILFKSVVSSRVWNVRSVVYNNEHRSLREKCSPSVHCDSSDVISIMRSYGNTNCHVRLAGLEPAIPCSQSRWDGRFPIAGGRNYCTPVCPFVQVPKTQILSVRLRTHRIYRVCGEYNGSSP